MNKNGKRIIISGGGTGGHLFPAIAIAQALEKLVPDARILFVGAEGKIEERKVPDAGYDIELLPVTRFARKLSFKNISFFFKLFKSMRKAKKIIKKFKPDVAVGVGGYASGPVLRAAGKKGVPTLIQEQNSYPGITNRLLAKRAEKICVAYHGTERFFPEEKIIFTGNPIRKDLENMSVSENEAAVHFGLDPEKKIILSLGGSGGARSINNAIAGSLDKIARSDVQLIWQTGKFYYQSSKAEADKVAAPNVKVTAFINRMDLAYKAADLVISRAGAGTISELSLLKKPALLVPSPNVAEDHQTKNAQALVNINAAVLVKDNETEMQLVPKALNLVSDDKQLEMLAHNIEKTAVKNSAERIANEVLSLTDKSRKEK